MTDSDITITRRTEGAAEVVAGLSKMFGMHATVEAALAVTADAEVIL